MKKLQSDSTIQLLRRCLLSSKVNTLAGIKGQKLRKTSSENLCLDYFNPDFFTTLQGSSHLSSWSKQSVPLSFLIKTFLRGAV